MNIFHQGLKHMFSSRPCLQISSAAQQVLGRRTADPVVFSAFGSEPATQSAISVPPAQDHALPMPRTVKTFPWTNPLILEDPKTTSCRHPQTRESLFDVQEGVPDNDVCERILAQGLSVRCHAAPSLERSSATPRSMHLESHGREVSLQCQWRWVSRLERPYLGRCRPAKWPKMQSHPRHSALDDLSSIEKHWQSPGCGPVYIHLWTSRGLARSRHVLLCLSLAIHWFWAPCTKPLHLVYFMIILWGYYGVILGYTGVIWMGL